MLFSIRWLLNWSPICIVSCVSEAPTSPRLLLVRLWAAFLFLFMNEQFHLSKNCKLSATLRVEFDCISRPLISANLRHSPNPIKRRRAQIDEFESESEFEFESEFVFHVRSSQWQRRLARIDSQSSCITSELVMITLAIRHSIYCGATTKGNFPSWLARAPPPKFDFTPARQSNSISKFDF